MQYGTHVCMLRGRSYGSAVCSVLRAFRTDVLATVVRSLSSTARYVRTLTWCPCFSIVLEGTVRMSVVRLYGHCRVSARSTLALRCVVFPVAMAGRVFMGCTLCVAVGRYVSRTLSRWPVGSSLVVRLPACKAVRSPAPAGLLPPAALPVRYAAH